MRFTKLRIMSVFVLVIGFVASIGLVGPASAAEVGDLRVSIVSDRQPDDAGRGDLITHVPFDDTPAASGFVQVFVEKVIAVDIETGEATWAPVASGEAEATFRLASVDDALPPGGQPREPGGTLTAGIETTVEGGIATFDSSLEIAETNALTTDYYIVPQARYVTEFPEGWAVDGAASSGFDIWDDGCHGTGCFVRLRANNENYTAQGEFGLAASQLTGNLGSCPTQRVIFSNTTFFHFTSGSENDVVFLETHITRADMKAATNNGQRHVGWCIGLESSAPWMKNGAQFTTQTVLGKTFYVAMAPKCPNKRTATEFAPCIVSQMGDNDGGSFIRGYVLGGDPPRRT
jgi:hypothetical protein